MKDPKLVAVYCRELLEAPDKDLTSELPKSLREDFEDEDVAESPSLPANPVKKVDEGESGAVKRALLDEFSSTQSSKKTKKSIVKMEK